VVVLKSKKNCHKFEKRRKQFMTNSEKWSILVALICKLCAYNLRFFLNYRFIT
jgi:hypothetical protein